MLPDLASLVALQRLDSAAEAARRRLAELPAAEDAIARREAGAAAAVEAARAGVAENQQARRGLEKDLAGVEARLARFEDHKAAVKTNIEFTALLSEIATAKGEQDAIEERILILMVGGDEAVAAQREAEAELAGARREGADARTALVAEREALDAELARLAGEREQQAAGVPAPLLARYDQLLKQRRGLAVARLEGEICAACHVRLRPSVAQQVRRGDEIVACDSCQRILYAESSPAAGKAAGR